MIAVQRTEHGKHGRTRTYTDPESTRAGHEAGPVRCAREVGAIAAVEREHPVIAVLASRSNPMARRAAAIPAAGWHGRRRGRWSRIQSWSVPVR